MKTTPCKTLPLRIHHSISSCVAGVALLACLGATAHAGPTVSRVGTIRDNAVTESSGLQASRRFPGVFWTHNDSGSIPMLFAITRQGLPVRRFIVTGEKISDWEDIALDAQGNLYLGDTGNNTYDRATLSVHMIEEPNPYVASMAPILKTWTVKAPLEGLDGEAIFVHGGYCYIIGKVRTVARSPMYRFALGSHSNPPLIKMGSLLTAGRVTAADISVDGQRLALVTEVGTHTFKINGNPLNAMSIFPPFTRLRSSSAEGGSFTDNGFMVSTEARELYLIRGGGY